MALTFFRKLFTLCKHPKLIIDRIFVPSIYNLLPQKRINSILSTWMLPENRTAFESFIYDGVFNYWIKNKYLVEADPSKREVLKDICMAGLNGVKWADNFEQRTADQSVNIGNPTFDETFLFWPNIGVTIPLYKDFISYLHTAKKGVTVVQIGCSSGRETDYFSQLFPDISFVGTDIDEMIIDRARKNDETYKNAKKMILINY